MRVVGAICGAGLAMRGFASIGRTYFGPERAIATQPHYDFIPVEVWGSISITVGLACFISCMFFKKRWLRVLSLGLCGGVCAMLSLSFMVLSSFWMEAVHVYMTVALVSLYAAIWGD